MGGGRLHASYQAGPITAWFDAFADFLINYKPSHFTADAGIAIGVRYDLDVLFIHTHISVEIQAELYMWGPPVAGRLHVDFWITSFDINFGATDAKSQPVTLDEFYGLVLQASSKPDSKQARNPNTDERPKNEGHTFLAQSGLMNNSELPERQPNTPWIVRGGTFSFVIGCKMAINNAERVDDDTEPDEEKKVLDSCSYTVKDIYAKPMKITSRLESTMTFSITQDGAGNDDAQWGMESFTKSVPTGLWGKYDSKTDPSNGDNHISSLLNNANGGVPLMMGILLTAPPATIAPDKLKTFNIEDAELQELTAKKTFPIPESSYAELEPDAPAADEKQQWDNVKGKWESPDWGTGDDGQAGFVDIWAREFGWDVGVLKAMAAIPKRLDNMFETYYVAAPLMTK